MKPLFIFGTRPETIKLAPLIRLFRETPGHEPAVCVTSQHRDLLRPMLEIFGIRPDHDFELMRPNQDLLDFSSRALAGFRNLFDKLRPDAVVVQGDTTTAFIAAVAAAYRQIPVAHVEAGLRSFRLDNPFPEEINRVLADQISRWCFAPTSTARANLLREGIAPEKIHVTGNTVVDALETMRERLALPDVSGKWRSHFSETFGLSVGEEKPLALVTTHRRESFGKDMESIADALLALAERVPDLKCVLPVHPNPNVAGPLEAMLKNCPRIIRTPPLDYEQFLFLLSHADLALTDSGGVQEEAPSFGVPVVVMRNATERPELIESGFGRRSGTGSDAIVACALGLLEEKRDLRGKPNPFGDGKASQRILNILTKERDS